MQYNNIICKYRRYPRAIIYLTRNINTVEIQFIKSNELYQVKCNKLKSNTKYKYEHHTHTKLLSNRSYIYIFSSLF